MHWWHSFYYSIWQLQQGPSMHGLIFYANIIIDSKINNSIFEAPNFLIVFVSWLNLDLGIDICFYNGIDSYYGKQLVFPAYIIYVFLLITIIIIACNCLQRIAHYIWSYTLYTYTAYLHQADHYSSSIYNYHLSWSITTGVLEMILWSKCDVLNTKSHSMILDNFHYHHS